MFWGALFVLLWVPAAVVVTVESYEVPMSDVSAMLTLVMAVVCTSGLRWVLRREDEIARKRWLAT
ncbi:hypothetical protein A6A25_33300 [Saccharothrix sp. CB00851]|nr:hypothetical protein A6A25_33300 [Saccharothrix sp. CB00851]